MYKIGIDVGGTNTDAVILDHQLNLIHSVKVPTTDDIQTGIAGALNKVLAESAVDPTKVTHAMLGTTQCTNAIVERKKLAKVGVLRLGYPATASVLPYTAWPKDLVATLSETYALAHGGYEYDGQPLTALDEEELRGILASWRGEVETIAVIGVFSSLKNDQELFVQALAKEVLGSDVPVSCSSMIGSVGLIERENATILNAALHKVIKVTSEGFEQALEQEKIHHAQVYLCQNDGTLMSLTYAKQFPILTIACGPTNSIRGASYLAGLKDAVVLDVNMPRMDGLELLEKLQQEHISATVIMVSTTTTAEAEVTMLAMERGAVDFVAKPYNIIEAKGEEFKSKLLGVLKAVLKSNNEKFSSGVKPPVKTISKNKV
ncbi:MAG: response regulator, partial [Enterococcus sp.]|nr:response regulator [Enterococcus sp.]